MKFELKPYKAKSNLSCIIIDNLGGCYLPVAHRMSKIFNKVYFYSAEQSGFPNPDNNMVGTGYKNINRVYEFWNNISLFDVIIFPDIYFNDWGNRLRSMGKIVWGGCESEQLETDRKLFKQELASVDLPVAPTNYIIGLSNLIKYLQSNKDKWLKISYYRGLMETFHHIDWEFSKIFINDLSNRLGPIAETQEFFLEDSIESICETGADGWTIDGVHPNSFIWGLEVKDSCYVGRQSLFTDMAAPVQEVYNKFQPVLQKYKHTGFYSTEIRYTEDGISYYTDPCMRAGSPPSNTYLDMIDNWDDIIIEGSKGNIIEPKFNSKYGLELILKSNQSCGGYLPLKIDPKYFNNVKLKSSFNVNGMDYIINFDNVGIPGMKEFGSVVVLGDDLSKMTDQALEIADSIITPYDLSYDKNALNSALDSLHKLEEALKITF